MHARIVGGKIVCTEHACTAPYRTTRYRTAPHRTLFQTFGDEVVNERSYVLEAQKWRLVQHLCMRAHVHACARACMQA